MKMKNKFEGNLISKNCFVKLLTFLTIWGRREDIFRCTDTLRKKKKLAAKLENNQDVSEYTLYYKV